MALQHEPLNKLFEDRKSFELFLLPNTLLTGHKSEIIGVVFIFILSAFL